MARRERLATVAEANPDTPLDPCLGKVRYKTEEEAQRASSPNHSVYFCPWGGPHYHTSSHGYKGMRRGR